MIWLRRNIFGILDIFKFIGVLLLVLMFIHFNTAIANQAQETQAIAASTNKVVKSQGDILKAIKQVTDDTRITAAQQTSIIICMLQVPVSERTTNLQARCRQQANVVSPIGKAPTTTSTTTSTPNKTPAVSSAKTTPSQPSSPQPSVLNTVDDIIKKINPFN